MAACAIAKGTATARVLGRITRCRRLLNKVLVFIQVCMLEDKTPCPSCTR